MFFDRRHRVREPIALRIALANGVGAVTRDIGPGGMYLRMPLDQQLDAWVGLKLDLARAALRLTAIGEVLRIERGERETGVALRLHFMRLLRTPDLLSLTPRQDNKIGQWHHAEMVQAAHVPAAWNGRH